MRDAAGHRAGPARARRGAQRNRPYAEQAMANGSREGGQHESEGISCGNPGDGVLDTSDAAGNVDAAIYSRPYVIDKDTLAFSMLERRSFANVQSNPKAAYMFIEAGEGHKGVRLYLTMSGEETDPDKIEKIKNQIAYYSLGKLVSRRSVYWRVKK